MNNICAKDEQGNAKDRKTGIGDTKTTFSFRDILVTDIVLETLTQWKDKQNARQQTNPDVTAILTSPTSFVFANDDGSYRASMLLLAIIKEFNLEFV